MNIFVLDKDPIKAAKMQCDQHVVKMPLESAQMLCSVFKEGIAPYKRTHYNHPCTKWVRHSLGNYLWLLKHGIALCDEYTERYDKIHACRKVIEWCSLNIYKLKFDKYRRTPFALAMPSEYKAKDPVKSYRAFYIGDKLRFARWNKTTNCPGWIHKEV